MNIDDTLKPICNCLLHLKKKLVKNDFFASSSDCYLGHIHTHGYYIMVWNCQLEHRGTKECPDFRSCDSPSLLRCLCCTVKEEFGKPGGRGLSAIQVVGMEDVFASSSGILNHPKQLFRAAALPIEQPIEYLIWRANVSTVFQEFVTEMGTIYKSNCPLLDPIKWKKYIEWYQGPKMGAPCKKILQKIFLRLWCLVRCYLNSSNVC